MDIDLIVHNATVVTMDEAQPRARTLAVHHGRVLAVDPDGLHGRTEIDAQGAALVPGFGDAHNHMAWFGQGLDAVDLSGLSDLDTLYHRVAERAATLPGHAMVVGTGYDDTMIGGHPRRRELDRAAGGRPVWLQHRSGHVCTVNSPVLERIGVFDGSASAPTGGVVVTDGAGDPTGVLEEQAHSLVVGLVVPYPVDELAGAIGRAAAVYAAEGLTHVTECGIGAGWIGRSPLELAAYQQAREAGSLGVRVQLMPSVDALRPLSGHPDDAARFGLDLGVRTGFGDERLRIGPMKIFLDGSLVARTGRPVLRPAQPRVPPGRPGSPARPDPGRPRVRLADRRTRHRGPRGRPGPGRARRGAAAPPATWRPPAHRARRRHHACADRPHG